MISLAIMIYADCDIDLSLHFNNLLFILRSTRVEGAKRNTLWLEYLGDSLGPV